MNINESARPVRMVEWHEEEDGRVTLKVRKFKGRFGKWLCRMLKRPPHFLHPLDEKGSFIWKRCDGVMTVAHILEEYEAAYGEETLRKLEEKYGKERIEELRATRGDEVIRGDALVFLEMLRRQGYIRFA